MNNCFTVMPPFSTWTYRLDEKGRLGRGGRRAITNCGVWVIQHEPTGKYIAGWSQNVSADVDVLIQRLLESKHPNKAMCKLVTQDPDLMLWEIPCGSLKVAKQRCQELQRDTSPAYCNLTK